MNKFGADIAPACLGSILCHTTNGKFMVVDTNKIHGWKWLTNKYSIDWWAYCSVIEGMLNIEK